MGVWWPFSVLFIGPELDDELAFVYHFHHHPVNVRLHQVSVFCIFAALQVVLLPSRWGLWFASAYILFYACLHVPTALVWMMVFALQHALAARLHAFAGEQHYDWLLLGAGLTAAMGFTVQIIGHRLLEGKFPAFRLFEAFVTTPFFLALALLFELGWYPEWRARLERKSPTYAKYTRRTY
jgi:uncharacterized membrane protein YGL010W